MKIIPLTRGFSAIVDDDDYESLVQHRWALHMCGKTTAYASRSKPDGNGTIFMHREIMKTSGTSLRVDHKVHLPIGCRMVDNRKENLRLASYSENSSNQRKRSKPTTSIFKGVTWNKEDKRWVAYFNWQHKRYFCGRFKDEGMAAYARDLAAVRVLGEFALCNFPVPGAHRWMFE